MENIGDNTLKQKTSAGTNETKTYFEMSPELNAEWKKVFNYLMKMCKKRSSGKPYDKQEYHYVADRFNGWLNAIATYEDKNKQYNNYFEWLNDQSKCSMLINKMSYIFGLKETEENYDYLVDQINYSFNDCFEEQIMTLAQMFTKEHNEWLEYFRTTDQYKQWIETNRTKRTK